MTEEIDVKALKAAAAAGPQKAPQPNSTEARIVALSPAAREAVHSILVNLLWSSRAAAKELAAAGFAISKDTVSDWRGRNPEMLINAEMAS